MNDTCHLYTDLAWLWPMWGDATKEYAHYCQHVTALIRKHAKRPAATLLNMGCGGGKNALTLKRAFDVTGVDLSCTMLEQAKSLNPECTFIQGDMRTCRLGSTFDAVLMDDAISDMNCLTDFVAAFRTAHAHVKPGGVLVVTPDLTTETFVQNRTESASATREGLDVVFVESLYDPDPADEQYEATILYLIRADGRLRIETDHWTMGLFSLDTWRHVLREAGFGIHEGRYRSGEDEYTVFALPPPSISVCGLWKFLIFDFAIWRNTRAMATRHLAASPDEIFKALGNPGRLTLVRTLMDGERCVCDLVHAVRLGWSTTSKHLEILRDAGVVSSEKRGQKIFYRIELECVSHFIHCLDRTRLGRPTTHPACDCA